MKILWSDVHAAMIFHLLTNTSNVIVKGLLLLVSVVLVKFIYTNYRLSEQLTTLEPAVVPKAGSVFVLQADRWKFTLIGDKLSPREKLKEDQRQQHAQSLIR